LIEYPAKQYFFRYRHSVGITLAKKSKFRAK